MKNFKISALRRCIGYVGQEFSGPVSISYPCLIRSHGGVLWDFSVGISGATTDTDFGDLQEFSSFCEVSFDLNVGRYISSKIPTRI